MRTVTMTSLSLPALLLLLAAALPTLHAAPVADVIDLWPAGRIPGPPAKVEGEERDLTRESDRLVAGRRIIKLGHVSKPQVHVYYPDAAKANGGAVAICPGGGFHILAWDLEGTEVAEWLTGLGFLAAVVKYRVPTGPHGDPCEWQGPVMDAQRALSILRSLAGKRDLDPARIGILGFSAGGQTAALAAVRNGARLYDPIDAVDEAGCRADFALLIYPGGIATNTGELKPEFTVNKETPPMFFAHAADDRVTPLSSTALFTALKLRDVPAELHVYARGGHGYGLRPTDQPVTHWPVQAEGWLRSMGITGKREEEP